MVLYLASHIWCRPYLMLQPETCWVLDDDYGNAVGYLLGVMDTQAFVQKYKDKYVPYLISKGLEEPGADETSDWGTNLPNALKKIMHHPEGSLHPEAPELIKNYPGHLHIDVSSSHQRQGYGRQLICTLERRAKEMQTPGIHLIMTAANQEGKVFYPKVGFMRFPQILDDGKSGEEGRDENTIWFVKTL